jgi:hypothetical protein
MSRTGRALTVRVVFVVGLFAVIATSSVNTPRLSAMNDLILPPQATSFVLGFALNEAARTQALEGVLEFTVLSDQETALEVDFPADPQLGFQQLATSFRLQPIGPRDPASSTGGSFAGADARVELTAGASGAGDDDSGQPDDETSPAATTMLDGPFFTRAEGSGALAFKVAACAEHGECRRELTVELVREWTGPLSVSASVRFVRPVKPSGCFSLWPAVEKEFTADAQVELILHE